MKRQQIKIYADELELLRMERLALRREADLHRTLRAALKVLTREWRDVPQTTVNDCVEDVLKLLE